MFDYSIVIIIIIIFLNFIFKLYITVLVLPNIKMNLKTSLFHLEIEATLKMTDYIWNCKKRES